MSYRISLLPAILCEFFISLAFILAFGFGNFLILLLASVALGVVVLAVFWKNMLEFQLLSPKQMLAQFGFIIAAFLLIIPGVLSSFLGLLILIFCFYMRMKNKETNKNFKKQFFDETYQKDSNFNEKYTQNFQKNKYMDEEIIDVEIIKD